MLKCTFWDNVCLASQSKCQFGYPVKKKLCLNSLIPFQDFKLPLQFSKIYCTTSIYFHPFDDINVNSCHVGLALAFATVSAHVIQNPLLVCTMGIAEASTLKETFCGRISARDRDFFNSIGTVNMKWQYGCDPSVDLSVKPFLICSIQTVLFGFNKVKCHGGILLSNEIWAIVAPCVLYQFQLLLKS